MTTALEIVANKLCIWPPQKLAAQLLVAELSSNGQKKRSQKFHKRQYSCPKEFVRKLLSLWISSHNWHKQFKSNFTWKQRMKKWNLSAIYTQRELWCICVLHCFGSHFDTCTVSVYAVLRFATITTFCVSSRRLLNLIHGLCTCRSWRRKWSWPWGRRSRSLTRWRCRSITWRLKMAPASLHQRACTMTSSLSLSKMAALSWMGQKWSKRIRQRKWKDSQSRLPMRMFTVRTETRKPRRYPPGRDMLKFPV